MAGNRNTRSSTRAKSSTKWWNVPASKIPADETIHIDYNDQAKTSPCNTKFVTTSDRVPVWVKVCKMRYNEEYGKQNGQKVEWREGDQADILIITGSELKDGKSQETCALSIHFWKNGTICIQGSAFLWWTDKIFPTLKKKVEETLNQNGDSAEIDATGNKATDAGSNTLKGKTSVSSVSEIASSENTDEAPVKVPISTPKKTRLRKAVENLISPFRTPTSVFDSPLNSSNPVLDTENTPSTLVKDPTMQDHIARDIQNHYTDLVDLVNTLQTDLQTLKVEQEKQKGEFEKELNAISREWKKQLGEEKTRHANESKSVNSRHNEEIATLTAQCQSLQSLVETQQQQIANLQQVTDSIQIAQSISKIRTYAETVKLNTDVPKSTVENYNHENNVTHIAANEETMDPGAAHANAATQPATETMVEEINSDTEPTQRVLSQERQQTPTKEGSKEVRVYADSIWNAVNVARMFPNLSTHKEKTTTILSATKKLETVNDPGTSYAILHVGSNDLDNTRRDDSSVQDCLQKTEELVTLAKTSFPNATIILSQVLPRGHNPDSTLNVNIKNYNQSVLRKYKDDEKILYIRHKKLSTSRHLYKRDGIHLDDISGTSLLVADVKRTIRSMENSHRPDNRENSGQHTRSTRDSTPLPSRSEQDNSTTRERPEQDVNRRQHFRDRDRPTRPWRADVDFPARETSRRPNYHRPQINKPHEDIVNLAYRLKELLNNF
ncbi:hypothetical protein Bbelb_048060 [Branchiostoma belcheri]|nr:hypothetical protein Bbelb_048060 [Branchiostoma belcheri]